MNLLVKIIQKFFVFLNKIKLMIQIGYWQCLYKGRLIIKSKINIGENFIIKFDASNSSITIQEGCQFRAYNRIYSGNNSQLKIEKNVFFNCGCSINCLFSIKIGNNSQFGENVCIYDHNHKYKDQITLISDQGYSYGEISIGSNCWIGSNVTILKGVDIGDNVIIGAGCVIHKSIPSNMIVYNNQELVQKEFI